MSVQKLDAVKRLLLIISEATVGLSLSVKAADQSLLFLPEQNVNIFQ